MKPIDRDFLMRLALSVVATIGAVLIVLTVVVQVVDRHEQELRIEAAEAARERAHAFQQRTTEALEILLERTSEAK